VPLPTAPKTLEEALERIELLGQQLDAAMAVIAQLQEKAGKNSRNSSKPPSTDSPRDKTQYSEKKKSGRKKGAQPGHKRNERVLFPPEALRASRDVLPSACVHCGGRLAGKDLEPHRHQVIDLPRIKALVDEWRLHTLTCPDCGKQTRAQLPEGVPTCGFGPGVDSVVAVLAGMCRLSKRTTSTVMGDLFGVPMCVGSVVATQTRVAKALEKPHKEAHDFAKALGVKHSDETTWWEVSKRAWLWTLATPLLVVFCVMPDRSAASAEKMLGVVAGFLNSDRAGAYDHWKAALRQLCWAHLERDFRAIAARPGTAGELGKKLLEEVERMWAWWKRLKSGELTRQTFRVYMRGLRQRVEMLLAEGTSEEHDKTRRTCEMIWRLRAGLWNFVHREGIEPTNNLAEQAIRFAVLWRKMSHGTQSAMGSRFVERIATVVVTLAKQGRSVIAFLREACEAHRSGGVAPSLLPVPSR
jgi:transposase